MGGLVAGGAGVFAHSGENLTLEFYVSVSSPEQDNAWVRIPMESIEIVREDNMPVEPVWFENFRVDPPLENFVVSPYGDVVTANFFMPNLENFRIRSPVPPENIPEEIENYADCYIASWGDSWIPARRIRVSFDTSPSAPRGEYKLYLSVIFTSALAQEGMVGAQYVGRIHTPFRLWGPLPPRREFPTPILLTAALVGAVVGGFAVGRLVIGKRKIRI